MGRILNTQWKGIHQKWISDGYSWILFDAMVQCIVSTGQIYIVGFTTSWMMTVWLNGQNAAHLLESEVLTHILLNSSSWNETNFEYTMEQGRRR